MVKRPSLLRPAVLLPVLAVLAGAAVVALTLLGGVVADRPAEDFFRDPTATAHLPWYVGSVSRLNGAVWLSAATLALFVGLTRVWLRAEMDLLAGFCPFLGADDMLLLHEEVGPKLGIPEKAFYVVYAVLAVVLALRLVPWRVGAVGWTFLVGAAFLGTSVVADVVMRFSNLDVVVEDSTKMIGALVWVAVPVLVSLRDREPTGSGVAPRPEAHARAA